MQTRHRILSGIIIYDVSASVKQLGEKIVLRIRKLMDDKNYEKNYQFFL